MQNLQTKGRLCLIFSVLVIIAVIIGIAVGVSQNKASNDRKNEIESQYGQTEEEASPYGRFAQKGYFHKFIERDIYTLKHDDHEQIFKLYKKLNCTGLESTLSKIDSPVYTKKFVLETTKTGAIESANTEIFTRCISPCQKLDLSPQTYTELRNISGVRNLNNREFCQENLLGQESFVECGKIVDCQADLKADRFLTKTVSCDQNDQSGSSCLEDVFRVADPDADASHLINLYYHNTTAEYQVLFHYSRFNVTCPAELSCLQI